MLFTVEYNNACESCSLCSDYSQSVSASYSEKTKVLVIKESPEYKEYIEKKSSIYSIESLIDSSELNKEEVSMTNSLRCYVGSNKIEEENIKYCKQYLEKEIQEIAPKVIITMGIVPYFAITGKKLTEKEINDPVFSSYYNCYIIPSNSLVRIRSNELYKQSSIETFNIAHKIANDIPFEKKPDLKYKLILDQSSFDLFMEELFLQKVSSVDIETTGLEIAVDGKEKSSLGLFEEKEQADLSRDKILGIGFSWKRGEAYYIPFLFQGTLTETYFYKNKDNVSKLKQYFSNNSTKIFHNGQFDIKFIARDFCKVNGFNFDTLIASFVIDENIRHDLGSLGSRYKDLNGWKKALKSKAKVVGFGSVNLEELGLYCCGDCDATFRLFEEYYPIIEREYKNIYYGLLMPMSRLMSETELLGVKVDVAYLEELIKEYEEISNTNEEHTYELVGRKFSIDSPKQLINVLYKELKLPVKKYNKLTESAKKNKKPKTPSTDEEALRLILDTLSPETKNKEIEIIKGLLEYRKSNKLLSTYLYPSLHNRDENDRIHPSYSLARARTGRTASSNPNIQNVPNNKKTRKYVIAEKGYKFITADFSQAEIRVLASLANDDKLKEAFMADDFHTKTASDMFGIPMEKVTKDQRNSAKAINFGIAYGITAEGLVSSINAGIENKEDFVTEPICQEYIDKYFSKYTEVKKYQDGLKKQIVEQGFVETPLGRKRRFDIYPNISENQLNRIFNQVLNFPIQAHASDMLLILCLRLNKELLEKGLDSHFVLYCHDEFVLETKEEEVDQVLEIIKEEINKPLPNITVQMDMTIDVTDCWF